jgi:hypothetical protein
MPLQYAPLGDWVYDAPKVGELSLRECENFLPLFGGYRLLRGKSVFAQLTSAPDLVTGLYVHTYLRAGADQVGEWGPVTFGNAGDPYGSENARTYYQYQATVGGSVTAHYYPSVFATEPEGDEEVFAIDDDVLVGGVFANDQTWITFGGGGETASDGIIPVFPAYNLTEPAAHTRYKIKVRYRVLETNGDGWSFDYGLVTNDTEEANWVISSEGGAALEVINLGGSGDSDPTVSGTGDVEEWTDDEFEIAAADAGSASVDHTALGIWIKNTSAMTGLGVQYANCEELLSGDQFEQKWFGVGATEVAAVRGRLTDGTGSEDDSTYIRSQRVGDGDEASITFRLGRTLAGDDEFPSADYPGELRNPQMNRLATIRGTFVNPKIRVRTNYEGVTLRTEILDYTEEDAEEVVLFSEEWESGPTNVFLSTGAWVDLSLADFQSSLIIAPGWSENTRFHGSSRANDWSQLRLRLTAVGGSGSGTSVDSTVAADEQNTVGVTAGLDEWNVVAAAGVLEALNSGDDVSYIESSASLGTLGEASAVRMQPFKWPGENEGITITVRTRYIDNGNPTSIGGGGNKFYVSWYDPDKPNELEPIYNSTIRVTNNGSFNDETYTIPARFFTSDRDGHSLVVQFFSGTPAGGGSADQYRISGLDLSYTAVQDIEVSEIYTETPQTARIEFSQVRLTINNDDGYDLQDVPIIFAGDKEKLYTVSESNVIGGAAWNDISRYTTNPGDDDYAQSTDVPFPWNFCSYGPLLIATNYVDEVQYLDFTNSGAVTSIPDLEDPGNASTPWRFQNLITSTAVPQARFAATVRSALMLANVVDNTTFSNDDPVSSMLYWSDFGDPANFDVGVGASTAGFLPLVQTPGEITGLVGGESAIVFKASSILMVRFVGGTYVFEPHIISNTVGCPSNKSIVEVGNDIFFWTGAGFAVIRDRQRLELLGIGKIDKFIRDTDYEPTAIRPPGATDPRAQEMAVVGVYDPFSGLIFWAYQGEHYRDETREERLLVKNAIICYNPVEDRFSYLRGESQTYAMRITAAASYRNLMAGQTEITRGAIWAGVNQGTAVYDAFRFNDGRTNFPGRLKTNIMPLVEGKNTIVRRVRPVYTVDSRQEAGETSPFDITVTGRSGQEQTLTVNPQNKDATERDSDGFYLNRWSGEFYEFLFSFPRKDLAQIPYTTKEVIGYHVDYGDEDGEGR